VIVILAALFSAFALVQVPFSIFHRVERSNLDSWMRFSSIQGTTARLLFQPMRLCVNLQKAR